MNRLERTLERLRRTQAQHESEPGIDDAILSLKFLPYAWRRLRNISFSQAAVMTIHCLEFVLLRSIFHKSHLVGLIFFQTGISLIISFWWGYLEHFRSEVHRFYRLGLRHELGEWVSGWHGIARLGSHLLLAIGVVAALVLTRGHIERANALEFTVVTLFIRAAFEFQMRFRNSIVFALQRVYRPMWLTLAIEISVLTIAYCTMAAIGANAFALGNLVGLVISGSVNFYYNKKALLGLRLPQSSKRGKAALGWSFLKKSFYQQLLSGFAMVSTRIGSLVVLLSFASPDRVPLFHILTPVLAASSFWVQTFHFDLRRYAGPIFERVRKDLQVKMLHSSIVVALILSVSAGLSLKFTGFEQSWPALLVLGAILFLRAWVAGLSLVRFVHRSYGVVVLSGGLLVLGILSIHTVLYRIPKVLTGQWDLWVAELCAFGVVYLLSMVPLFWAWSHRWLHSISGQISGREFSDYLDAKSGQAFSIRVVIPNRRLVYYRCLALASVEQWAVYRENAKTLWFAGRGETEQVRLNLLAELSGWIERIEVLDFHHHFKSNDHSDAIGSGNQLRLEFVRHFPGQVYWVAGEPIHAPHASRALMREWFKQVCMALDYVKFKKMEWDIVPLMVNGQLSAFFVINKSQVPSIKRQEFRARVESFQEGVDCGSKVLLESSS